MTNPNQYFHPATGCLHCPALVAERHHVVWGSGPRQARVLMMGEAPGFNEDMQGIPFIGAAGRIKDQCLADSGLTKTAGPAHIMNTLMCRPPGNRDPEPQELENCSPWVVEHIASVNPQAIICFGRFALAKFFDKNTVKDTQGLMYVNMCDTCGAQSGSEIEHLPRKAIDGLWQPFDTTDPAEHATVRRLIAAIYHPASALPHRRPENLPMITHQLRRVADELAYMEEN
jgi:uracil-DNA glycosylase family 4